MNSKHSQTLIAGAIAVLLLMASSASAKPSTNSENPTWLVAPNYFGSPVPSKQKTKAYFSSSAGLWALQTDNIDQRNQFKAHQGAVLNASFSPDGKYVATAGNDGLARLWNLSGQQLTEFKGHQRPVFRVSFSPDGKLLATAGYDGTARLRD